MAFLILDVLEKVFYIFWALFIIFRGGGGLLKRKKQDNIFHNFI